MKHKSVIVLKRKKKYGALMSPFFGIKSINEAEDVDRAASKFGAILSICFYRQPRGHGLRWRMRERARKISQ